MRTRIIIYISLALLIACITYCPLCNSGIVFDRRVKQRELSFGVSGMLRRSDMIMFDHQTESWWQQFTGEALVGELAGSTLKVIPSQILSLSVTTSAP